MMKLSREDLQALPTNYNYFKNQYDEILFFDDGDEIRHDSGYRFITLVGCLKGEAIEQIACGDHLKIDSNINIDCLPVSGAFRLFKHNEKLTIVSGMCSSIEIF